MFHRCVINAEEFTSSHKHLNWFLVLALWCLPLFRTGIIKKKEELKAPKQTAPTTDGHQKPGNMPRWPSYRFTPQLLLPAWCVCICCVCKGMCYVPEIWQRWVALAAISQVSVQAAVWGCTEKVLCVCVCISILINGLTKPVYPKGAQYIVH